jgi:hypothetical protein
MDESKPIGPGLAISNASKTSKKYAVYDKRKNFVV